MLSFLLLASSSGQPLPGDAVARCSRLPARELTFVATASTTWRTEQGHVLLAAWADRPGRWHIGGHGCTLTTSTPWPLASRFTAPSGIAFELTDRLGDGEDPGLLSWLTGAASLVRVRPDGTGFVGAPPTGGGAVHIAHGDGVVAISDRASIAAGGAGGGARRTDLAELVRGSLLGDTAPIAGVERLRPGGHVQLRGRLGAKIIEGPMPWGEDSSATTSELVVDATDDVVRLVELAAERDGRRVLELGSDPGSLVIAAAVAATGTSDRFELRARAGGPATTAAVRIAELLGVPVASAPDHLGGGEALDARVRAAVSRVEAQVAPASLRGGPLSAVHDERGVIVGSTPGGPLAPDPGPTGRRLLTSQAWSALEAADGAWAEGRGRAARSPATRAVMAELDRRSPRRQRAAADLAGTATVLDPLAIGSIARLALAATVDERDATALLVEALHPPMLAARTVGGDEPAGPSEAGWRALAPVLESHVLGHARDQLGELLDLDEVAMVVRSGVAPDADTVRTLEGALALAVWSAGTDTHTPSHRESTEVRADVATPDQVPTIVTGVTSRSLLTLADLHVPLDAIEPDALLGIDVDRDVRDLVHRILLAVGATPGHLPPDLDERLSGPATVHLVGAARTLLARRGGTLADARLALTLPFWRAHVAPPRVVLVAERPPDLAMRSTAQLPTSELLGWWVDAMTSAAASGADVRIVDPGDLLDLDETEAIGWEGLEDSDGRSGDLVRVIRTVDSLVREVELESARPLLRTIRLARATDTGPEPPRSSAPAAAPLHVVDELWERAVESDRRLGEQRAATLDLEARLAELQDELHQLKGRRGFKAAWEMLRGRDG